MLVLKNLVKEYKKGDTGTRILDEISLEFKDNEFVSVIGPTGSGKTTLLCVIGGLDRFTSGELSIDGKSADTFSEGDWNQCRRHTIGFVFQRYELFENRTLLANIETVLALSGTAKRERRAKVVKVLERVGLGDQLTKTPDQLTRVQYQLAMIARALINDPNILLVDELLTALDQESSVQVMALYRDIAKDKLVIMASSNPELSNKYASRVITMSGGCILADSRPYHVMVKKPLRTKKRKNGILRKKRSLKIGSINFFEVLSFGTDSLLSKKPGTLLSVLAGCIAVIGIALSVMLGVNRVLKEREAAGIAAVSLIFSCILIGPILYNSLTKRKREIGTLRSIGASGRDICGIFSAETGITGLLSGVAGVFTTITLSNPINMIIRTHTGIEEAVTMNPAGGFVLIVISITLNMLAGLVTFRLAGSGTLPLPELE